MVEKVLTAISGQGADLNFDPVVDRKFPLEAIADAHHHMEFNQ